MSGHWNTALQQKLSNQCGKNKGAALFHKYVKSFPTHYHEECSPAQAVSDILRMEKLSKQKPLEIALYQAEGSLRLRLFQANHAIPLSDILPMLENFDLRTIDERPYQISLPNHQAIWISDFTVVYPNPAALRIQAIEAIFEEAFLKVYLGAIENDGFNKLVLGAALTGREIIILRAYTKYLHQIRFRFSQAYIERSLAKNIGITRDLICLFLTKFTVPQKSHHKKDCATLTANILQALENVISLDEDRILRRILDLMNATLRTNYFQKNNTGDYKPYLALKLLSKDIPELPLPQPLYEIFIYSPRFEGIHLRNAKVARGGIRWSDRREDFRTEILGLMKAQVVKNAVIVPSGAKGGFVLKTLPDQTERATIQAEVVFCYQLFIRGLLDLTDNLIAGKVIHPPEVICYDDDDPYLVVAADKGTATFSDIANDLSKEYEFWLHDAFASGGSAGYDHKKIGITARGAWESIKRHFCQLGINIVNTEFTAVAIGDMSGDVFGNGMLYSKHTQLLAAFDHRDIFLDPNPKPEIAYQERKRLFNLPTSSWQDYNIKLLSKGGGVYSRSLKTITLSPEIKKALAIQANALTPHELIRAILTAPVDLLYNGGIGTYVKASSESQSDVGDKTNEFCRVNGGELRCKVVGEGGNLGLTQLGRIEYALNGGLLNTDFIDNSGGVDCSDHEVNIKILLNKEMLAGKITEKNRNQLLMKMTQEIADLVLADNYHQAFAMSFASLETSQHFSALQNCLNELEKNARLDRVVEFLPDDKKLLERKAAGLKLTSPELAVIFAHTKIYIKNELLKSNIMDDPYLSKIIETAFPPLLAKKYAQAIMNHDLRREIIATQLSNTVVNRMGITFVQSLQSETGATVAEIVKAYAVASEAFEIPALQKMIEQLDFQISVSLQYELLHHLRRLMMISTRWFLQEKRLQKDTEQIIQHYQKNIQILEPVIPQLMVGMTKNYLDALTDQFMSAGLTQAFAKRVAVARALYASLNIIEIATSQKLDLIKTATMYFSVGKEFNFVWFRDQIGADVREGFWNALAKLTLRDDLDALQRKLSIAILNHNKKETNLEVLWHQWVNHHQRSFERWEKLQAMLHGVGDYDYAMFFIALRELDNLIEG